MQRQTAYFKLSTCLRISLAAAAFPGLTSPVFAGHAHTCQSCGCHQTCRKICRLKCGEKEISVTCWGMKDEDFCIGAPSCPQCDHCETVCGKDDDKNAPCTAPKRMVWTNWLPGCGAHLFTKHKLMKKVVTKKVPSFQWVVEDLCAACSAKAKEETKENQKREAESSDKAKDKSSSQPKEDAKPTK